MSPTLLIVDDNPGFRRGVRSLLTAQGFDVVGEAGDGRGGIEATSDLDPDVVLLDVDLPDALRRIRDGGTVIDQTIVAELVGRRRKNDPLESLTKVEREVLELMAQGRTNQAIADQRVVTLRAVEKHVTAIFEKLGLPAGADDHRRVLAVLAYLRAGS